jgi:hypothetical protein
MATEAARLKRKNPLVRKRKTDLTLTGLLMEGLGGVEASVIQRSDEVFTAILSRPPQFRQP